jgi:UDP-2,3-diacylglucosamine hydrolase
MSVLFISDLHLSQDRPEITALFQKFLHETAPQSSALYILGDLFEVWLGDDMILPDYQAPIEAMHTLSQNGTRIYIMYGNRDFLMKQRFEQLSGATIIYEPTVIDLYGTPTLLLHGDTLCTDDLEYLKFRSMVRNPQWQAQMLAKTPQERLAMAKHFREVSKSATAQKASEIMDVNQQAVENAMQSSQVHQLIHGHTHRPAVHQFTLQGEAATRIVLADWYSTGSYLIVDEQGYRSQPIC